MSNHTDPQGGHTAKYPTLTYSHETGFAELTPEQQDRMTKALGAFAEAVVAQKRQDPRGRHIAVVGSRLPNRCE